MLGALMIATALWAGISTFSPVQAEVLVAKGDGWRYFKGRSAEPPKHSGTDWTEPSYDDPTGWGGPAPSGFGYGDADDATPFDEMQGAYAALYIRTSFDVADPAAVRQLTLAADYDDGFVAYINGVEVARRNLPPGPVTHTTLAIEGHEASHGDGPSRPQEQAYIAIEPAALKRGRNVLAVSGHNRALESSDFSLLIELYADVNLVRGPYLQMRTDDDVTVVWYTDAVTEGAVDYGLDTRYLGGTVTAATPGRRHAVSLSGLAPGTEYFYRVRSDAATLSEAKLRTPGTPGQPYRFAIIGDFGYRHPATDNIAHQVNAHHPDWLMTVGDNIYLYGQPGGYDEYLFRPYGPSIARAPLFPALGNHDIKSENGRWFIEYFDLPTNGPPNLRERNYSFDYGNAHVAVIDSNPFHDGDPETMTAIVDWLAHDLGATSQPWKFVALHHPAYTSVGHHDYTHRVRARLAPLFEQARVQVVFQGHNHFYERLHPIHGVRYITTGAGGMDLHEVRRRKPYSAYLEAGRHSFTLVDVDGTQLTLRAIDEAGAEIDKIQLVSTQP